MNSNLPRGLRVLALPLVGAALAAAVLLIGVPTAGGERTEAPPGHDHEDAAIWCPCTGQWVNRIDDCPDCRIDGLYLDRNPRLVTVRGNVVQGRVELTVGQVMEGLKVSFVWNTGDTLSFDESYVTVVEPSDPAGARWEDRPRQGGGTGRALGRGRMRGIRPGSSTLVFKLKEAESDRVVYTSPPVPVLVRPRN